MNKKTFNILSVELMEVYKKATSEALLNIAFNRLEDAELSADGFSFHTSVASVYSSKIEGEHIELDSYIKHKRFGISFEPDYTQKIVMSTWLINMPRSTLRILLPFRKHIPY